MQSSRNLAIGSGEKRFSPGLIFPKQQEAHSAFCRQLFGRNRVTSGGAIEYPTGAGKIFLPATPGNDARPEEVKDEVW
jgi:hypothetical protein